jgi:hypothetical protein
VEFCLCVSLERLATFVLSIPEGVVERRTAVHLVRAFTSIWRECVWCFINTWKGDCLGSSSRGQPRGALPLHQVTQRQFIKFADPTRRSGHNNLLHVLPRRVHINNSKHPNHVYKLSKTLYRLKQAPRSWYAWLKSFLLEHGYVMGSVDKTLFTLKHDNDFLPIQIYVDDVIFGSSCHSLVSSF